MFKTQLKPFWASLADSALQPHADRLRAITDHAIEQINQGDLHRWLAAFDKLPEVPEAALIPGQAPVTIRWPAGQVDEQRLEQSLRGLHPWRKGPFQVGDCLVDAEWRSDFKWQRVLSALPPLQHRTVLDVGCGNGYYLLKMAEHRPRVLLGIEPGLLQNVQFWAVEKYAQTGAAVLPLRVEAMPADMRCFDVVFSMGILYHRKSPIDHLEQLKNLLSQGGQLVLETLVVDGDATTCLVPPGRYAQMRNVWFLPSVDMLCLWLRKVGFKQVTVVDVSRTTTAEQRSTDWMQFHSLPDFLSEDQQQTTEGHPPPQRVIITATK
ncbi:tRNA 5-methoxyuridine(34)/uridine 5-oxyacetic acid(34) synthase CmoB [Marinicella meishanensis]|uniref:tRNA 5-methoxyuridine(34)/uridine 5-oxyacetic acid(34) synthase CmoB n=1 Tax=Marinicella meishanensis TaxID=2873263 RepID=UPI001CBD5241|nr:tRNA 5-methoxyuridine(34)/uridine 5-oxyacetic acid(34) synthase CmoB [Marinicella sp. NBU2979]